MTKIYLSARHSAFTSRGEGKNYETNHAAMGIYITQQAPHGSMENVV